MQLRDRTGRRQTLSSHDLYLHDSELDALEELADVATEELTASRGNSKQQRKQPSKAPNKRPRLVEPDESDEDYSEDALEASGEEEELPADLAG